MKKYLFLFLAGIIGLPSCNNDDNIPVPPALNKLTNITCFKNGATTPYFAATIVYDRDGLVNRIETDKYIDNYIYGSNSISVNGVKTDGTSVLSFTHTVYTLSGNILVKKVENAENKYANNEVYPANTYVYNYNGLNLDAALLTILWPNSTGGGYEKREYGPVDKFTWENGNVTRYAYIPLKEMVYEYGSQLRPQNFPFRVTDTFRPIDLNIMLPVNMQFGNMNRNLPQRAYWYNVSEANTVCAQYLYRYTVSGDYLTNITIDEKINPVDGAAAEENTYQYSFAYNYSVNK